MLFQSLVLIFKGKGDPLNRNLYRDIKLLEHAFNLSERILNNKLREIVYTGSMPGRRNSWCSVYYEKIDRKVSVERQEAVLCKSVDGAPQIVVWYAF